MRIALSILIGIHGIIHLFGFFKAFGIAECNAITHPISKNYGIGWLLTFLLFAVTLTLIFTRSDYWWLSGFLAVIFSQGLVFYYWSDAKYGSIANLIILLATLIGYASANFKQQIKEERTTLSENVHFKDQEISTQTALMGKPQIVQKWLTHSGVLSKGFIADVKLVQELDLQMKPKQTSWNKGRAEQYITVQPPAFHWSISTKMNSLWSVVGRDKFEDGKGGMIMKLFSLIPVAKAENDEKLNQATLQRYLAEIVWFPSAARSPYIEWEHIDEYSARATMEYKGTKGSGVFHFDKDGTFKKFVAMRYQDATALKPTEWTVIATKTEERNGVKIPVECEASWELETGKWTWLKLKITDIDYNLKQTALTG